MHNDVTTCDSWDHYPMYAAIQKHEASKNFLARRRRKKWTGWRPKNDEATIEFQETVMNKENEGHEENLETIQKSTEEAAGSVALTTNIDRDNRRPGM